MNRVFSCLKAAGCLLITVCFAVSSLALTGEDVLLRMNDAFNLGNDGEGLLVSIDVRNEYASGVSREYRLAVVADSVDNDTASSEGEDRTTYLLMYFLGGDEEGMIFLLHLPEGDNGNSRMWLYLSSFGLTKELISDADRSGTFAGSTFTYADIAGARDMRSDYRADLLREDNVTVGSEERPVWVLRLTPRADTATDYAQILLWVDQEADLFLRLEGYGTDGTLMKEIVVTALGSLNEQRVPETLVGRDLTSNDVSTIRLVNMRRPDETLAPAVFEAESLATFDPAEYGF